MRRRKQATSLLCNQGSRVRASFEGGLDAISAGESASILLAAHGLVELDQEGRIAGRWKLRIRAALAAPGTPNLTSRPPKPDRS